MKPMKYKNKVRLLNIGRGVSLPTAIVSYIGGGVRAYMHSFSSLMNEAENKAYLFLDEAERRAQEMSQNLIEHAQNTTIDVNMTQDLEVILEKTFDKVITERINDFFPHSSVTTQDISAPVNDFINYIQETWDAVPYEVKMPFIIGGIATLSYFAVCGELRRLKMNRKAELENNEEFNRIISSENKKLKTFKSYKKYEDLIEKEIQEDIRLEEP